jgi:trk system potassium uptake protein TrkA
VRRGRIRSVHTLADGFAEIIEADALETSKLIGVPLKEANLPPGILVGAILRGDQIITPRGDSVIEVGDRVVIFAVADAVKHVEKMFSVRLEFF